MAITDHYGYGMVRYFFKRLAPKANRNEVNMGCCGNKRSAVAQTYQNTGTGESGEKTGQTIRYEEPKEAYFKYTGNTALSVRGLFSRRTYRFRHPGDVLAVSGRDAPSMKAIPMLKQVRKTA